MSVAVAVVLIPLSSRLVHDDWGNHAGGRGAPRSGARQCRVWSGATQDGVGSRLRPFESALPVARCVVLVSTVSLHAFSARISHR